MIKRLCVALSLLYACTFPARATTYTVNSGQSTATIQGVINGATSGSDTVLFSAGTYNFTTTLTMKCGVTYTGPTVSMNQNATYTATAILNASSAGTNQGLGLFNFYAGSGPANPCTQATTVEYLNFSGADTGILVQTPYTNLNILRNQFTNIPGRTTQTAAIVYESVNTTSNTNATLTATLVDHNQLGDANSCISPSNVMALTVSPETYQGACNGQVFFTSINGFTFTNNLVYHVSEGTHINCPNYAPSQTYPCEPPGGAITENMTVEFNDFYNIHRIAWEEQPQQTGNINWQYNSEHDWVDPYFGAFGVSFACCYNGTISQPNFNGSNNVIIFNTVPVPAGTPAGSVDNYGYGMEAMGNEAIYNNELVQAVPYNSCTDGCAGPSLGMAYGRGPVANMNYNIVQGNFCCSYINNEGLGALDDTPTLVGNVTGPTVSTVTSMAPSISPTPTGTYSTPITVTLTDPGFSGTTPGPQGNTSIFYTTDGSTPTTASARYTGPFSVAQGSTVNAIGMWGTGANALSYPAGYGFVPSSVVSAHYVSSGGGSPTLTGVAISLTGGGTSVAVGGSVQAIATCSYTGSITTNCTTADAYGTTANTWLSSVPADATVSSTGSVAGVAAGSTNLTVKAGSFTATAFAVSVTSAPANILGNNAVTTGYGGYTSANYTNNVYAVTGTNAGGYTVSSCSIYLTQAYPAGSKMDCVVNLAPSPTTRSSSDLCWATYTATGTSSDIGWQTLSLSTCGPIPPSTAYWVETVTNASGTPGYGFWTCGSTTTPACSGGVPTLNNGTYHYFYASTTYGSHTGLGTSLSVASPSQIQPSQYLTLATPQPTLVGGGILVPGGAQTIVQGASTQLSATCTYSNGQTDSCTTPDQYGNTVTAWITSNNAVLSVGSVGSTHPGLATAISPGTVNISATLTGGITIYPSYPLTVTASPTGYPPCPAPELVR